MRCRTIVKLASWLALMAVAGCLAETGPPARRDGAGPGHAPLFARLGGIPGITAVVDELLVVAGQDARVRGRLVAANMARLRGQLIDQICMLSGGPCVYRGLDMQAAHRGMGITSLEFDAFMDDVRLVLDRFRMPAPDQHELLALLTATKSAIVGEPAGAPVGQGVASAAPNPTAGPAAERAQSLREAASLLDRADGERQRGNRSLAEQLFSFAEMIVGMDALASLANLFREGAPPRVTTPTVAVSVSAPPQPQAVGSSDDEEPPERPARGALAGDLRVGNDRFNGFAVVTLEPATGRFRRRPPRRRVIEQRNREFAPHVLVVPVGSTVAFPNFDGIYHNVFSRSAVQPFDLGLYKAGQEREVRFDKEGVVRIGCNLHANMSAVVAVVLEPYYAVTDAHGHFEFRSLPPGNYRLRVYTETRDEPVVESVRVLPERNTVVVTLPEVGRSEPLADKFGVPRVQKNPP